MHLLAQPIQSLSCGSGPFKTMQEGRVALKQHIVPNSLFLASNGTSSRAKQRLIQASCLSASMSSLSLSDLQTSAMATTSVHAAQCQHSWGSSSVVTCNSRSSSSSRTQHVQARVFDKIRDFMNSSSSGWAGQPEASSAAGQQQSSSEEDVDDGADMVRIDMESTGGLGGTTEEVFGPLVSNQEPLVATAHIGLLWQTAVVPSCWALCTGCIGTTGGTGSTGRAGLHQLAKPVSVSASRQQSCHVSA